MYWKVFFYLLHIGLCSKRTDRVRDVDVAQPAVPGSVKSCLLDMSAVLIMSVSCADPSGSSYQNNY